MALVCPSNVVPHTEAEGVFTDNDAQSLRSNSLKISQQIGLKQKLGFPDSVAVFK